MKITKLALLAASAAAATITLPATARADSQMFQTPSGNIACMVGAVGAACDIAEYTYQVPPGPECAQHIKWGNRFTLDAGKPGAMACHGDTLRVAGEPTLGYGQSLSGGNITCTSDPAGVKCTDKSTGHYFQVSKDSYQLG